MRDAVLDVFGAGGREAEGTVEADQVGLGVQCAGSAVEPLERGRHEPPGDAATPPRRRDTHPADADAAIRFVQHPQVPDGYAVLGRPQVPRAGLGVPAVQLRVRAVLLDDEHVHAQPQQRVEGRRIQLVERRVMEFHYSPAGSRVRLMELMQYRWSVGVPYPSPSKT